MSFIRPPKYSASAFTLVASKMKVGGAYFTQFSLYIRPSDKFSGRTGPFAAIS